MQHKIVSVKKNSPAQKAGISAGDFLTHINNTEIYDIIDYEHFTCLENLSCTLTHKDGTPFTVSIKKDMYEPLGLDFESSLMSPIKSCKNHCIFCFIDQMPQGGRKTLHFKDDDWRLSLIMGNYVTLTNVSEDEFERIINRRVSPLYISVHATNGEVRKTMMRNPTAPLIMQRLKRLKEANLRFHAQIVLCPEINDGDILKQTITDLYSLYPAAQSVAVVPVGLTQHREGLFPLRRLTQQECKNTIALVEKLQNEFLQKTGTRFVFIADEMYTYVGLPLPQEETYEDYPQIENGVGLLRKFEDEFMYRLSEIKDTLVPNTPPATIHGACGFAAKDFLQNLFNTLLPYGICVKLHAIKNNFFGESVTVSGLVTAGDIAAQLKNNGIKKLVIPSNMLRENSDVFLDGNSVGWLKEQLCCNVYPLACHDGGECLDALINALDR